MLLLPAAGAMAGGFDNTGRPFGIIFDGENQPRELRWAFTSVAPDIRLDITATQSADPNTATRLDDLVPDYHHTEWSLRWNLSDSVSCALRAEQPFRALVRYPDDALTYRTTSGQTAVAPIESRYDSESLTIACRRDVHWADYRVRLFGGPKHQQVGGYFSADLSEQPAGRSDDLEVRLNGGSEWGFIAGLAFEIPAIALRASVIYHSAIDYSLRGRSLTPVMGAPARVVADAQATTRSPEAWHLGLQSGVAANWLVYAEMKWSAWSTVDEIQVQDGVANPRLSLYQNDTLDFELGLIHRASARLRWGLSYGSGIKLGTQDLPPGVDSANLRDPQGKRHALTLGSKYWLRENLATDLLIVANYLESKVIEETNFSARVKAAFVPAIKWGVSWHL